MSVHRYLNRNLHSSWQVFAGCMGVFVGVLLAPIVDFRLWSISWLLTGTALMLTALVKQKVWLVFLAVLGGLFIGLWRGQLEQLGLSSVEPLYGTSITIKGTIAEDADRDKHGNTVVRLKNVTYMQNEIPGKIWIMIAGNKQIQRSDVITIQGKFQSGFGTFVGSMYRAEIKKIERPEPGDVALRVRDWFATAVRRVVPEPQASLGVGYLVGQRRNLPPDLDNALKVAGLTHIVVASGYNLTILVRLARRLFVRVSKYLSMLVSSGLIVSFIAITGMSPSMSRAGLVAGLSLAAWYYGRKFNPLILLAIAVATTVLINPFYAWGDVGWQLSFAAFAGVMIFAPLLQAYYFGDKKPGTIRQILGETFSAWLFTLPILMYTFGYISNVAILANMLVLPFVPLAMLLTFIAGLIALTTSSTIATIAAYPDVILLSNMTQIAEKLASVSWAQTEIEITSWHVAGLYALIISFTVYMWLKTRLALKDSSIIE